MKKEHRIQLFIILNILILIIAIGSIYFVQSKKGMNDDVDVLGKTTEDIKDIPYTHNLAPQSVITGSVYDFTLNIYTQEDSIINIKVVTLPKWMYVENNRVYGIPSNADIGNHELVYSIDINGQISEYRTNILVYESNEE